MPEPDSPQFRPGEWRRGDDIRGRYDYDSEYDPSYLRSRRRRSSKGGRHEAAATNRKSPVHQSPSPRTRTTPNRDYGYKRLPNDDDYIDLNTLNERYLRTKLDPDTRTPPPAPRYAPTCNVLRDASGVATRTFQHRIYGYQS
eukprot:TRINITY_DN8295_c0_g2_i1.p1 TRINITY_DN8295_c0_g2~~TRINITY_DN8295_c0_g2_i1.p1  ORF type:complete len:152 (+),score=23.68 TRINITY_DN8295_c0_g2_i1:33-458(+)